MKRTFPLLAMFLLPALVRADVDAEVDRRYELKVVMRCGAHNWLGTHFRTDLRGNLSGMLADALGTMAEVTVVDLKQTPVEQWAPLWKEVDSRGLAVLDGPRETGPAKTHFLRVDFVNGQYEIQSRQIDGQTGWVSPWRRERTPDRAFVARLAGRMIAQDFGLIGTVVGKGDDVRIRFRGGAGAQLGRWVERGDVFAVMRVVAARSGSEAGKERVLPVEDTVIRVTGEPKNGECEAKVVYRARENPIAQAASGTGFRCIKVGATRGTMRLRLVNENGQPHNRTLQVRVHTEAFQSGESVEEEIINPDRGGLFVSRRNYDQVAYARIVTGARQIARVPVPIQEGREVVVTVGLDAEGEQAGQLQALRADLSRQFTDSIVVQINSYKDVTALVKDAKNEAALKRAKAARTALEEDQKRLNSQMDYVKSQLTGSNITLADCEKAEKDLENHRTRINRMIGQLEEMIRLENAPDRVEKKNKLQQLNTQAQAAIGNDDYDTAISIYRQIVRDYPEETAIKKTLEKLEDDWAIKSDAHGNARLFVTRDWPGNKSAEEVSGKLAMARTSLQVLAQVRDRLTLAKFRNSFPEIGKLLGDEVAALKQNNPNDAEAAAKLKKVIEDFVKFQQEMDKVIESLTK